MIKPTVGRNVWFWPYGLDRQPHAQPYAASIAFVHSDTMINIGYLTEHGEHRAQTSVRLLQDGDSGQGHPCYAEWMPFQVGQAKATAVHEQDRAGKIGS